MAKLKQLLLLVIKTVSLKRVKNISCQTVVYVASTGVMYGATRSLFTLISNLKSKGIIPIILCSEDGDLCRLCQKKQIDCISIYTYRWQVYSFEKVTKAKLLFEKMWNELVVTLYKIYLKKRYGTISIVHSNTSVISIGAQLSQKLSCPHIWHIREFGQEDFNMRYLVAHSTAEKRYQAAAKIVCISQAVGKKFSNEYRNLNIEIIYNGINIPKAYKKTYLYDNKVNFVTCGLISESKNQKEIIHACVYLKQKGYSNFIVHLIGGGHDAYLEEIKQIIKLNKLENHIIFYGYCKNAQELYVNMDVGIMPSRCEAFGRVTIEYMSNYMPVIGANTGATAEIIKPQITGYIYSLGNSSELAAYMERFITNHTLIRTMGDTARVKAETDFSQEQNSSSIYKCYKEVLGVNNS